ncbi:SsgA family sporulation/cell division regulator [Streptomyces sp. NBC_00249]|uniref:SsgA family sporulation/cell division regulator n=1 Tax=Streptomyces sp. NBC_00249 TaxID=2975690 RepID=UPI0022534CD3|nr:SsgA family sporulation/cell division regulator [Streptomyces sp. NBC_00249]MCX5194245.1 SsgA family sporulation/cell division regulator [Streptomyces sp. NBC_00249]
MATTEHRVLPLRLEAAPVSLPLQGAFVYRTDRPYELAVDFRGAGMHLARWVFSRELLIDGQTTGTGEGDIQVWPRREGTEPRVFLAFSNGVQGCVVSARAKDVRELCRRMTELVPRGQERRHYDLDAELSTLLAH